MVLTEIAVEFLWYLTKNKIIDVNPPNPYLCNGGASQDFRKAFQVDAHIARIHSEVVIKLTL